MIRVMEPEPPLDLRRYALTTNVGGMTRGVKLTPTATRTLKAIVAAAGDGLTINTWAGQKGIHPNSLAALSRAGLIEDVPDCANCANHVEPCLAPLPHKNGHVCYCRVRVTDAGLEAAKA